MYEDQTFNIILNRMLARVDNSVDKREASLIYTTSATDAIEHQNMYISLDAALNEAFADTASRPYLIRRAAERGLIPANATYAVIKVVFNKAISIGARFTLGTLVYDVSKLLDDVTHTYELKCETAGTIGNQDLGNLIPVENIAGLTSAIATELITPGEDEEDTEVFRQEYFNSLESQSFGGNKAEYKAKVNAIPGVGGTKIYPVWNGGGTVKIVIINSEFKAPSNEFVNDTQELIDPIGSQGQGNGIAPIDHEVTVEGATNETVNIVTAITYQSGYDFNAIKSHVFTAIDDYFLDLSKTWQDETNLVVRISQVETRLLGVTGIIDVGSTTLNGTAANLTIDADKIPVRGTINGSSS
ncbi:MAG: putative phage Mu protein -like protein [Clostridiaceae bacterium]|nr:putative phage Mu protein -like protein [Clostridiaceae bacterium]